MDIQDIITLGLMFANMILAGILSYIYYTNNRKVKSKITIGLLLFALMFFFENIFDLYFYNSILVNELFEITTFHLAVNFLEMLGLLALLRITWD